MTNQETLRKQSFRINGTIIVAALNVSSSTASTYDVGDTSGWTTMGNIDYNKWSSSKSIHVGDTIRFVYNPKYHNVLQVTSQDYESCTTTSPLATYTTGNDSIQIKGDDTHYYFICGVPGHCKIGQKVDIQVSDSLGQATKSRSSCYSDPCTSTPTPSFPRTPYFPTPSFRPPPSSMIFSPPTTTSSAFKFLSSSLFIGLTGVTVVFLMH
ncbi:mavicyanin-like [Papaver somniferum]|uniref:mavicyanin-like n=1 Tax=Papaver somniferum TaxID=3469 RepID=UPI000E6F498B|nr:mavicyanin-like [Papaver somniferum]